MGNYIERQAAVSRFEELKEQADTLRDKLYLDGVLAVIDALPTAEPETMPVVRQLRAEVANLKDRLSHLEYWQLNRKIVLESAAQDRAAMNVMRKRCEKTIAELREELKQVKAERDAAVSDLEEVMAYGSRSKDTCQYCGSGSCYARNGGKPCYPKWRGPQKEATNDQS